MNGEYKSESTPTPTNTAIRCHYAVIVDAIPFNNMIPYTLQNKTACLWVLQPLKIIIIQYLAIRI